MVLSKYNILIENKKYNNWLLYNSLHNSLVEIDDRLKRYLDGTTEFTVDNRENLDLDIRDSLQVLKESGFIVEDDFDETDYAKRRDDQIYQNLWNRKSVALTICPTYHCNLSCSYCFVQSGRDHAESPVYMNTETQDKVVQLYENYCKKYEAEQSTGPRDRIMWYGGEPLLYSDVINSVQRRINVLADKYGRTIKRMIVTNGIVLTRESQKILKDNKIQTLQVTLDGPPFIHNKQRYYPDSPDTGFEIIMQNLSELDDYFHVMIRINVDKENSGYLEQILDEFNKRKLWPHKNTFKIKIFPISDCYNEGWDNTFSAREFQKLELKFRESQVFYYNNVMQEQKAKFKLQYPSFTNVYRCMEAFHKHGWVIGPGGGIYTCWENIGREQYRVGTIDELLTTGYIKDGQKYKITEGYRERFNCYSCNVFPICQLGCFANYYRTGKKTDKVCSIWKFSLKEVLLYNYDFQKRHPELSKEYVNQEEDFITK